MHEAVGNVAGQREEAEESCKGRVGKKLEAKAVPMTFHLKSGGVEVRVAPLVYIPNRPEKVFELLDENNKYLYCIH